MKTRTRNIIFVLIIVAVLAALATVYLYTNQFKSNPPGTVGNTAGNLNNSGLFCEYDGTVYFANSYDDGKIYAMDVNEGNMRKLNNITSQNILVGGNYIYYFQLGSSGEADISNIVSVKSFNRMDLNGKNGTGIIRKTVVKGQLVDNHLYLLVAGSTTPEFYKIKIDKSESKIIANYEINPASAVNGTIYYNGTRDDHYLYAMNTTTGSSSTVWQGNIWYPCVVDNYVYYLDVENEYRLCRYNMSANLVEVLTEDRIDSFNVGNGYIYYQKSSATSPQLKCMRTDGSNVIVVAEGVFNNINMTSQYVYFQAYGNEVTTYHSSLGSASYSSFDNASRAVISSAE
ncbi:DUF5050 domain-containing protein [Lachnospiraceae bacterium OttesenSCG-928-D06]|nr:DUF5050 domain-containing protein [Lachnospiraceae bacterium OttesenSCG-928-D06]